MNMTCDEQREAEHFAKITAMAVKYTSPKLESFKLVLTTVPMSELIFGLNNTEQLCVIFEVDTIEDTCVAQAAVTAGIIAIAAEIDRRFPIPAQP